MKKFRSNVHEVHVCRIHKGSPYNLSAVIPEIRNENRDDVINTPDVQNLINKTYGKKLIVQVHTEKSDGYYLQYEVEKPRAVLPATTRHIFTKV